MEQFRIDNYLKGNDNNTFPHYQSLELNECKVIMNEISNTVLNTDYKKDFWSKACVRLKYIDYSEANLRDIENIFTDIKYDSTDNIYIIWSADEIDIMSIEDVFSYWNYLWYPPADDAIILYSDISKAIFIITHWNRVYYF